MHLLLSVSKTTEGKVSDSGSEDILQLTVL